MNRLKSAFRAFKYRNYRLFFTGQGLSALGGMMQQMAQSWLVYRITDSPLMLGIVAFAGQIPSFLLTPAAGIVSDRYDKRKIILLADIAQMAAAFVFAALVFADLIMPWHIIVLSVITGSAGAFEMTTRHSFVPQMVEDKNDLGNAIALNSVMFNMARLIGPALAGVVVAVSGEGICFLINGVSFVAVIAGLLMMKIKKHVHTVHKSPFNELKEGFKYVFESVPLKSIITLMAFVSFAGSGVTILLPVFARDILHGDSMTYGFLTGAVGLGALTGALGMAAKKTLKGLSALMSSAVIVFGAGLFLASFAGNLIMAMALLLFVGAGTMLHMASSNTIIQTVADDDKRGRVISFYILSFSGFLPLGSLVSGWLAKIFGVRHVIAAGGILTALAGVILLFFLPKIRRSLRSVYIKKGIIPSETVVEIK